MRSRIEIRQTFETTVLHTHGWVSLQSESLAEHTASVLWSLQHDMVPPPTSADKPGRYVTEWLQCSRKQSHQSPNHNTSYNASMILLPAASYRSAAADSPATDSNDDDDSPLSPFPFELLALVLDALRRHDLATCVRVNSAFCSLSLPLLHHSLRLSEDGPWPLFDDVVGDDPLSLHRRRKALAIRARKLAVHPHSTDKCHSHAPFLPPLPHLHVLRVHLGRTWSGAHIFHTNVDLRDPYRRPDTPCAALHNVRAPTLVVRGLSLARSTPPRKELPQRLEDSVDHYIVAFEPDKPYFLPRNAQATAAKCGSLFCARLPPNCTRVTILFQPQHGPWRGAGNQTLTWRLLHAYATAIWTQLAVWLSKRDATQVTIVNCGAIAATDGSGVPDPDAQARMQAEAEAVLGMAVRDRVEDAERVLAGIRFITIAQYLASEAWEEVFDVEEVAAWR